MRRTSLTTTRSRLEQAIWSALNVTVLASMNAEAEAKSAKSARQPGWLRSEVAYLRVQDCEPDGSRQVDPSLQERNDLRSATRRRHD